MLPANLLGEFDNPLILLSPGALSHIHAGFAVYGVQGMAAFNMLLQAVKMGLAQSVHNVFVLSLVVILFGLIAVFFLKEIPLKFQRLIIVHCFEDSTHVLKYSLYFYNSG